VMLRVADRQEEATRRFIHAARLAPADADPLFNLGGSHEALERHEEALHAYRGALERERKNEARIQNNIGNVLGKTGRWPDALVAYHEAQEADPDFPETYLNLGHVLGVLKRFDEAEHHLSVAARLLPAEAASIDATRAELLEKQQKAATAQRRLERREEVNKRDGHLTREQRAERFQQVVGVCGMDKACMRRLLEQEDAREGDAVVF
jgi:tetratricopeptide (TPR) repeat protein